jgi:hypothetical protein
MNTNNNIINKYQKFLDDNFEFKRKIVDSFTNSNFEEFKNLYNEFVYNDKYYGFFTYDEYSARGKVNYYILCSCQNKKNALDFNVETGERCYFKNMLTIHKHNNLLPCNCVHGKRYCLLVELFKEINYCKNRQHIWFDITLKEIREKHMELFEEFKNTDFFKYILQDGPVDYDFDKYCVFDKNKTFLEALCYKDKLLKK